MADEAQRKKVRELYSKLTGNQFSFMGKGKFTLTEIYSKVEENYSHLCDDKLICCECCKSSRDQIPEWKHRVRTALSYLKDLNRNVKKEKGRGCWEFGE